MCLPFLLNSGRNWRLKCKRPKQAREEEKEERELNTHKTFLFFFFFSILYLLVLLKLARNFVHLAFIILIIICYKMDACCLWCCCLNQFKSVKFRSKIVKLDVDFVDVDDDELKARLLLLMLMLMWKRAQANLVHFVLFALFFFFLHTNRSSLCERMQ